MRSSSVKVLSILIH